MSVYRGLLFPLIARLDAETAHERVLRLLSLAGRLPGGRGLLRAVAGPVPRRPVQAFGLTFPNVLGVAAGFDKDVQVAGELGALGFGHVEVGTLTPRPQAGNPRPRVFRLTPDQAVINRMGFPNGGVEAALPRLQALSGRPREWVLGVSIGKQKETPLEQAVDDYVAAMRAVYPHADYLAVNISSPNTVGLRELQGRAYLASLLSTLVGDSRGLAGRHGVSVRPLLLKVAPDLTWPELDDILAAALENGIDGIIATNTTLSRTGLSHAAAAEQGGLSGRPLSARSTEVVAYIHRQTAGRLPIIGVGGIFTAADVQAKLDAGAVLVQTYTGMIYEGPGMAGQVLRSLARAAAPQRRRE